MRNLFVVAALALSLHAQDLKPPVARKVPKSSTIHGETRVDEYGWIRDKTSADTIAYLEAENAYAAATMKPLADFEKKLYDEMLGRIKQTDVNVPWRKGGYFYHTRTEEGKQYPIYARKKGSLEAAEEILLDANQLAAGKSFFSIAAYEPSDDGNLLLYSTDTTGYRQYKLHVKDLRTGQLLPDTAEKTGSAFWAADNKTYFYTVENPAKRQWRLHRHVLGSTDPDPLVQEEADELYDLSADRTRSGEWIVIESDSKTTSETRILRASDPTATPRLVVARKEGHKYYLDHRGDRFFIMTNDAGINYRVVSAPVGDPSQRNWTELIPYRKTVKIDAIDPFANHLVIRSKEGGLGNIDVIDLRDGKSHRLTFPEPAYALLPARNEEFATSTFNYIYQSLVTPSSFYAYDMGTRKQTLLKRQEVLGGYDPAKYKSERIFATAKDGARIPVALVYRKDVDPRGKNPLLLTAYGSYGASSQPNFASTRLSLLDRGVTFAIAQIRGGGELGKEWHEAGRMMTKKNTFTDFIAVAEHLVKEKYTAPDRLAVQGGSAGGLLMGAVANMRPDLFKVILAYVPFVDVINTMLDPTLPLTTQEYIEWGNPNDKAAYDYMKSYDPYMNVSKQKYPSMLVRTALNDSQVGYWEGVKWVARLRANKTDANPLLLRVNMGAGHGGASGRYDKLREDAHDYTFLLWQLGVIGPGKTTRTGAATGAAPTSGSSPAPTRP